MNNLCQRKSRSSAHCVTENAEPSRLVASEPLIGLEPLQFHKGQQRKRRMTRIAPISHFTILTKGRLEDHLQTRPIRERVNDDVCPHSHSSDNEQIHRALEVEAAGRFHPLHGTSHGSGRVAQHTPVAVGTVRSVVGQTGDMFLKIYCLWRLTKGR